MPVTDFQQLTVGNVTARAYLRVAHGVVGRDRGAALGIGVAFR